MVMNVFCYLQTFSPEGAIAMRSPTRELALSNHPARKFVMDFLRVIIVDSLSLPVSAKSTPALDLVLEVIQFY